jgi:hypothetical protein
MSNDTPAPKKGNWFNSLGYFLLMLGAEALVLSIVWEYAIRIPLGAPKLEIGHFFLMLIGFKMVFRDLLRLGPMHTAMKEIAAVQLFALQNNAMQFSSVVALLNETIKETEKAKAEYLDAAKTQK